MAGRLPSKARLHTLSLQWLDDLLSLFSVDAITIPPEYRNRVLQTKKLLTSDSSGLVSSLLDFAISSASVNFFIESNYPNLTEILENWLSDINIEWNGKIPVGVKALAKEYFRERWKGSSFLLLRTIWAERDDFYLPVKMAFVDGEDIVIEDNDKSKAITIGEEKYNLFITENENTPLPSPRDKNENIFVQKPYESWSANYPVPFLIRRGIYRNLKFLELLQQKGERVVAKALEYLFLIKKGTEQLALTKDPNFIYSETDLLKVKDDFNKIAQDSKTLGGTPTHATGFDTILEHFIPEYTKIVSENLYAPIERKILAGLGLIEIVRGVASDRREAILNPRPFVSEIKDGVEGFKTLLTDIIRTIIIKNDNKHRKYTNAKILVHSTPVKEFITEEIRTHLRSAYDRGVLSKRTYAEIVADVDFDIEKEIRKKEAKDGTEIIMYPPLIQNREEETAPEELERRGNPKLENEDKKGIEKKNFTVSAQEEEIFNRFAPEIIRDYFIYKQRSGNDFDPDAFYLKTVSDEENIKVIIGIINETGEQDIWAYLFGKDIWTQETAISWLQKNKENFLSTAIYEEAPYKENKDLPEQVKVLPPEGQSLWKRVFNESFPKGEDYARRVAWAVIKRFWKKENNIWIKKKRIKGENGEFISLEEGNSESIVDSVSKLQNLELKNIQLKLAKKILGEMDDE